MAKIKKTFGSWPSPIIAKNIVSDQVWLDQIRVFDHQLYWLETRPAEKGRATVVMDQGKTHIDLIPADFSARSRVHEYGGACYCVGERGLYFVNDRDQQIYFCVRPSSAVNNGLWAVNKLTEFTDRRFADLQLASSGQYLICISEQHFSNKSNEPENSLVQIDTQSGKLTTLHSGEDFYASPAIDSTIDPATKTLTNTRLAWLSWNHPDMPWERTRLWTGELDAQGFLSSIQCIRDKHDSVFQPRWSADQQLYYVADSSGWWNIYRYPDEKPLLSLNAEFALPQWVFGQSTYAIIDKNTLACSYKENGLCKLATISIDSATLNTLPLQYADLVSIQADHGKIVYIASSATDNDILKQYDLTSHCESNIKLSSEISLAKESLSVGEAITFKTADGSQVHAFYYAPINPEYEGADGEKPPLIVISHGGPTTYSSNSLSLKIQFWTSRGFAVLDVNYRGSTGFGRDYRDALRGQWGIADVEDCIFGAKHLSEQQIVDKNRLLIRGGSAGGYTTLCALTFHNTFKAGASYYGISDLKSLALDTHKFESRYLDRLIGKWPDDKDVYAQRSPVNYQQQLDCPVIFFQGLKDKVVPPNQAECMVTALIDKGFPVAYVTYEDEAHGFRQAENIAHSLEAELYFYGKVLGFKPEPETPVPINNIE